MILVDTSVWIDHLHHHEAGLSALLERGEVLMHPLVIGELACGSLRARATVLRLLQQLPAAAEAGHGEALRFLDHHRLMGRGIGYVDVHLLASAALGGDVRLWTRDRRLAAAAAELGLGVTGR